jgi:glucoamylase
VPLVWAHAEYLKLLRSTIDGRVFDRIEPVYERYSNGAGRANHGLEISSPLRPIQRMDAGRILRILNPRPFELVCTADGWNSRQSQAARSVGSAGFSADIVPPAGSTGLEWTQRWLESDTWLGYNVKVKIDAVG